VRLGSLFNGQHCLACGERRAKLGGDNGGCDGEVEENERTEGEQVNEGVLLFESEKIENNFSPQPNRRRARNVDFDQLWVTQHKAMRNKKNACSETLLCVVGSVLKSEKIKNDFSPQPNGRRGRNVDFDQL